MNSFFVVFIIFQNHNKISQSKIKILNSKKSISGLCTESAFFARETITQIRNIFITNSENLNESR